MMYAIKVDGVNFWEEREAPGRQVHRAFEGLETGERDEVAFARFTQHVDWTGPDSGERYRKRGPSRSLRALPPC